MIKNLTIHNFKSIKELSISCNRVNVFIGEPNTGKSNLLESIGLLSGLGQGRLNEFVRFTNITDLFHFFDIGKDIHIKNDEITITFKNELERDTFKVMLEGAPILSEISIGGYGMDGKIWSQDNQTEREKMLKKYKFYKFQMIDKFERQPINYLYPPIGKNLSTVILTNSELREQITSMFNVFGYQFIIEEPQRSIKFLLQTENLNLLIPYNLLSDTLQRMIFYLTAIYSNKESIIVFNEPESNAFPYYTRLLAETIAHDSHNQYFISTHNPYFLITLIEKCKQNDIGVFITYVKNYVTKVRKLQDDELPDILSQAKDPFFNINSYIK